jgi:hypothetical protein
MKHLSNTFFLILVFIFSLMASDTEEIYHLRYFDTKIPAKKPVLVRTYPVYQGNGTFLLFFLIEMQNDFLQFVYDGGDYNASAEFEIDLKNTSTNQLRSKIFRTQVQEKDFRTTNRRDLYHFASDSFEVKSGEYEVIFKYSDVNGKGRQQSQKFKIRLPSVDEFYASSILFTYPDKEVSEHLFYSQPSALRSHWGFNQKMGIQLNTWQTPSDTIVKVKLEISDTPNSKSVYSVDTLLAGSTQNKSVHFTLPQNLFSEKEYLIKIRYSTLKDTTDQKFPLNVIWFEKPLSLWNINSAIGPLEYVIKDDEIYQNLAGGKIYILYGEPDEVVDNSLAPISNPFLRWIYYLEDKQLSFTFLAVDGRKRYRLANVEENPIQ